MVENRLGQVVSVLCPRRLVNGFKKLCAAPTFPVERQNPMLGCAQIHRELREKSFRLHISNPGQILQTIMKSFASGSYCRRLRWTVCFMQSCVFQTIKPGFQDGRFARTAA
jgi:hypothetical protein